MRPDPRDDLILARKRTSGTTHATAIVEHVAGIDDFEVAEATYRAAAARWPAARITLRQGARIVHESGQQE
jgi:hypothetical protein